MSLVLEKNSDLARFRDLCFQDCLALKAEKAWSANLTESELFYCHWLGLTPDGESHLALDPALSSKLTTSEGFPSTSLTEFRSEGYLGEAIYAALIRSSYGSDRTDFFPTRSELGFYFDLDEVKPGLVRWDEQYLSTCQKFFIEELTPEELVDRIFSLLADREIDLSGIRERWEVELRGVAFLVGEEQQTLLPLVNLFFGLLRRCKNGADDKLASLTVLLSVEEWSREAVEQKVSHLSTDELDGVLDALGAEMSSQLVDILYASGPSLMAWRLEGPT